MKFYVKQLIKTPMLIVFIIMCLFFGLVALSQPAEVNRYAIATAIGIDLADDSEYEYEISYLVFVPVAEETFTERYKMISSKGNSISEATDYVGLHLGREVGLSHIKFVVISEDLLDEDVSDFLDFLTRNSTLSSSTKFIATDSSAKDFLDQAQKLDSESSIKVSELISYNLNYIYATDSSLETFFKGTYGPTGVGLVSKMTMSDDDGKGISVFLDSLNEVETSTEESENSSDGSSEESSSDGSSDGSSESSGSGSSSGSGQILNNGDTIVFKNGKKKLEMSGDELKKINFLRGDFKTGSIEIKDFSNDEFENGDMTFDIVGRSIKRKVKFENGIPVIYLDLNLSLVLSEIKTEAGTSKQNVELFVIDDDISDAIEKEVRTSMSEGLAIMRENQLDMANFYTRMYNSNKKAFLKFLDNLDDPEDYLNNIIFKVSVRVFSK